MTKQEAIDRSIAHWERMIRWIEKQPKKEEVDIYSMVDEIDEGTGSMDCPLCKKYQCKCDKCPLGKKFGYCIDQGSVNSYYETYLSETWDEWLRNARILLKQLKSLREE